MSAPMSEVVEACAKGDLDRVRRLFPSKSSLPLEDANLDVMILQAAENGHADVVRYLVTQGAKISFAVITEASDNAEVFKTLVLAEALDVNEDFGTAGDMLVNAVWELKYDFTKWLLSHGANPNSGHLMADSTSAITAAAIRGRLDLADLLLIHGAKISGTGALAGAAEQGHLTMVRWLLDHGAAVDEIGVHDYGDQRKKKLEGTALHKAVGRGDVETARLLIDRGAKSDIEDPMGRTPYAIAKEKNQQEAVRYLESMGVTR